MQVGCSLGMNAHVGWNLAEDRRLVGCEVNEQKEQCLRRGEELLEVSQCLSCVIHESIATVDLIPWGKTKWGFWPISPNRKDLGPNLCCSCILLPGMRHEHMYLLPSRPFVGIPHNSSHGSEPIHPGNLLVHTGSTSFSP